MEECRMKMMEEMMPAKMTVCKNATIYKTSCKTVMEEKMEEEEGPICKIRMTSKNYKSCEEEPTSGLEKAADSCSPMLECRIGMKKKMKKYPRTECEKVATGEEEKCVEMVQLKKEMHETKFCSFHPMTMCRQAEGRDCRKVKRRMCNFLQKQ